MIDLLKSMLADNAGGASSVRVVMLLWLLLVAGLWAFACIKSGTLVDIPSGVQVVTGAILAAKATQRFGENVA